MEDWEILSIEQLENIPRREHRSTPCIYLSNDEVRVRGEALDEIWWRGRQWAVTAYGIEKLDGTYVAEAARLLDNPEYPWPVHMAGKNWVDIDEFTTAWMIAIVLHGRGKDADPSSIREMFGQLPPSRRLDR